MSASRQLKKEVKDPNQKDEIEYALSISFDEKVYLYDDENQA